MSPAVDARQSASDNAAMEARLARIETHVEHLIADVADLRAGSARLETKVDHGFARLDSRIDSLAARVDRDFLILGGMIVTLAIGMAGLMAKGFHWL